MPHEQNQYAQWVQQERQEKNTTQTAANSAAAPASSGKKNTQKTCNQPSIPCEQLLYLATTLAIALSKGKTAAETEIIAQFLSVTVTSLTSLAFCKAKNENLPVDVIPEEI